MTSTRESVRINVDADVIAARQKGRAMAQDLGLRPVDQTRLATAISELARNILRYGGGGFCHLTGTREFDLVRIEIVAEDHGPGIPDIDLAMSDGFSTGNGLGAGLPGARRLVDQFSIQSEPGLTLVSAVMERRVR